ncbi:uncharacterized protein K460DRAFT_36250 [Cucurbitaria berberidis CBS 394.84]|uniref:BZIP domain-containing protein n=1 Tax=Cucurbitaria berberidis CBS 394.84 TaxID=1168544 RepID=A0A9P4GTH9_9PLEO|nr:uncharacterized protein K460DRAFT_36250 [Cucurbitaria berberidis CBS 394.84]KAF1851507.1 hypothetical protein K460DRAFT_36250 [Cucurbitaria berberidis CBS 394.84]
MTSSESEEQAQPRKRSRTSNSTEDGAAGGKKARGRPRVDTQDSTAADRRRTQIRLAQRAYRQRKETTISSLKSQGTQLHSIIEQMNKTFLQLNESALKSGLLQMNPSLAQEFKLVTETFTNFAKIASDDQHSRDGDHEGSPENSTDGANGTSQESQIPSQPEPEPQQVGWGYSAMNPTGKVNSVQPIQMPPDNYFSHPAGTFGQTDSTTSLVRRRQFTVGDVLDQSRSSQASTYQQSTQPQQPTQLPFGLVDLLGEHPTPFTPLNPHIYSVNIPTPDFTPPTTRLSTPPLQLPNPLLSKTLKSITTYSFDETTFARRLTRASLEAGFQLLSSVNPRPAAINYVFKLSLSFLTREELRTRLKAMLSRGVNEELDWWETPFIHLGGAGTHYPRRDASGHIIPIKNSWTARQIGPFEKRLMRLENVQDGRWEDLDDVDLIGFEGEWFDAYDVQGYLEDKYTCRIDPKSSFAECLIEEEEASEAAKPSSCLPQYDSSTTRALDEVSNSPSLTHSSASAPASSTSSSASFTPPTNAFNLPDAPFGLDMNFNHAPTPNYPADIPKLANYDISFDQTLGLDLAPGFDYGFAGAAGGWSGDMQLGLDLMGENVEVVKQKRKKTTWVDTTILINELLKHGVCLGRAPGFRRKHVDMALRLALIPPY